MVIPTKLRPFGRDWSILTPSAIVVDEPQYRCIIDSSRKPLVWCLHSARKPTPASDINKSDQIQRRRKQPRRIKRTWGPTFATYFVETPTLIALLGQGSFSWVQTVRIRDLPALLPILRQTSTRTVPISRERFSNSAVVKCGMLGSAGMEWTCSRWA